MAIIGKQEKKADRWVHIGGVRVSGSSRGALLRKVEAKLVSKAKASLLTITTPNPEQVVQAQTNDVFRLVLNTSEISLPDGGGLVLASKLYAMWGKGSKSLKMKMGGREFALEVATLAKAHSKRVFLLGSSLSWAEVEVIRNQTFAGLPGEKDLEMEYFAGAQNAMKESDDEYAETIRRIRRFKPAVLLVAFGAPAQELWVDKHKKDLEEAGVRVVMVVGGAIDVWAGRVSAPPQWVVKLGFEWFWRLVQQPWRWKRQLRLVSFARLVAGEVLSSILQEK